MVALGRLDEAEAALAPFETLARQRDRHSAMANAARVRGRLEAAHGRPDAAQSAFAFAPSEADQVPIPLDRALTTFAYGHILRRAGRRGDAAVQLGAARKTFARLEALPYIARCEQELAACGRNPAKRKGRTARVSLTP